MERHVSSPMLFSPASKTFNTSLDYADTNGEIYLCATSYASISINQEKRLRDDAPLRGASMQHTNPQLILNHSLLGSTRSLYVALILNPSERISYVCCSMTWMEQGEVK